MTQKKEHYYPVPRVADGLGNLVITLYSRMCRKTSYRSDDDYTGGLPINDSIPSSQLIVTIGWMQSACLGASRAQIRTAVKRLAERGALVKIADEGMLGIRYFLPHQEKVRTFKKDKNEQPGNDTAAAGEQQGNDTATTGQNVDNVGAETENENGQQQGNDTATAGEQQGNDYNTKYIIPTTQNTKHRIDDDDDSEYDTFLEQDEIVEIRKYTKQWYLELDNTPALWRTADQQTLENWLISFGEYDFRSNDVVFALHEVKDRIGNKKINSLNYFTEAVWEQVKLRRDKELA